jgi:DNA (cytosine-5)-methyltransferase 1
MKTNRKLHRKRKQTPCSGFGKNIPSKRNKKTTFTSLLRTITLDTAGTNDYRKLIKPLFVKSKKALSTFAPLGIGSTDSNPIQVIDFFSGAGGTSLGFAAINKVLPVFHFLAGCDINPVSAATYAKNFGTPNACKDIIKISKNRSSIWNFFNDINFDNKKPSVLIGCAPCQGFSSHRKKLWDEKDDNRNNLIVAFSKIVTEVMPTIFIVENVPEFLSNRYLKYFKKAKKAFFEAGYIVKQNIYNAAEFGVPQERFRSIIIGMKKDFLLPKGFFSPDKYKTVRDAIGMLQPIAAGETNSIDALHKAVTHKRSTLEIIKKVPHNGGNLPKGVGPPCLTRVSGFSDVYGRLSWNKPAITITHYARNPASGRYTHPEQDRGLTIREVARLQSFPDGFKFEGKSDDIYRQIGEAVPPLLACGIIANILIEYISRNPTNIQIKNGIDSIDLPVSNSYSSIIAGIKNTRRQA